MSFIEDELNWGARFLERFPHVGIFASFSGFGASVLAAAKVISIFAGAAGAIFGCVAGYYTMRCWHHKWKREREKKQ